MIPGVNDLDPAVNPVGEAHLGARQAAQQGMAAVRDRMQPADGAPALKFSTYVKNTLLFFPRLLNFSARLVVFITKWAFFPRQPQAAPARRAPEQDLRPLRDAIFVQDQVEMPFPGQQISPEVRAALAAPLAVMVREQIGERVLSPEQDTRLNNLRAEFGTTICDWDDLQEPLFAILNEAVGQQVPEEVQQRCEEQRLRGIRFDALIETLPQEVRKHSERDIETERNQYVSDLNKYEEDDWEALPGELIQRYEDHQKRQAAANLLERFDEIVGDQLSPDEIEASFQLLGITRRGVEKGTTDEQGLTAILTQFQENLQKAKREEEAARQQELGNHIVNALRGCENQIKNFVRAAKLNDIHAVRKVPDQIRQFIKACALDRKVHLKELSVEDAQLRFIFDEVLLGELPEFDIAELALERDGNTLIIKKSEKSE